MNRWKTTENYKNWAASNACDGMSLVEPGHPYQGHLSMTDLRLKFSQAFFNTERGKKLNQTIGQTSKAVGGAITSARSAISSWWTSQWNSTAKSRIVSHASALSSYTLSGLIKSVEKSSSTEETSESNVEEIV